MSSILGAILVPDEQVRIALTKMAGIGSQKAMKFCSRLGLSRKIKIHELTKFQIDQIEQILSQSHLVHWEWKRRERADIERLKKSISRYRGIRHQEGLPLRGQRIQTNARRRKASSFGNERRLF